jgi:PIN domain nuclease of toxin-antitoxin system
VILLLDAHALLWWLADDRQLAVEADQAIRTPVNDVLVSAATVWEIEIKRALGRLEAPEELVQAIGTAGFAELPITGADGVRAARLARHHQDPFDRMLVAQAGRLDATVVSRDPVFDRYGTPRLPA